MEPTENKNEITFEQFKEFLIEQLCVCSDVALEIRSCKSIGELRSVSRRHSSWLNKNRFIDIDEIEFLEPTITFRKVLDFLEDADLTTKELRQIREALANQKFDFAKVEFEQMQEVTAFHEFKSLLDSKGPFVILNLLNQARA
jgi:hypothetical protein